MLSMIISIAWVVFFVNALAAIGGIFLGKALFNSNLLWLEALVNPSGTSKFVNGTAQFIINCAGRAAIAAVILYLL